MGSSLLCIFNYLVFGSLISPAMEQSSPPESYHSSLAREPGISFSKLSSSCPLSKFSYCGVIALDFLDTPHAGE